MSKMSMYALEIQDAAEDLITNMDGSFTLAKDEAHARVMHATTNDGKAFWQDVIRMIRDWEVMS